MREDARNGSVPCSLFSNGVVDVVRLFSVPVLLVDGVELGVGVGVVSLALRRFVVGVDDSSDLVPKSYFNL